MNRKDILQTADQCVSVDRAATHGSAENSFAEVAKVWNWWLSERLSVPLTAHDVAMMMGLFKDARTKGNLAHADNYIDACGYRAIAGELAGNPPPAADLLEALRELTRTCKPSCPAGVDAMHNARAAIAKAEGHA